MNIYTIIIQYSKTWKLTETHCSLSTSTHHLLILQGLDTISEPEPIKLKDAAKLFGKKFASGAAVSDGGGGGGKEIVIQGDVQHDVPELLVKTYVRDIFLLLLVRLLIIIYKSIPPFVPPCILVDFLFSAKHYLYC